MYIQGRHRSPQGHLIRPFKMSRRQLGPAIQKQFYKISEKQP